MCVYMYVCVCACMYVCYKHILCIDIKNYIDIIAPLRSYNIYGIDQAFLIHAQINSVRVK